MGAVAQQVTALILIDGLPSSGRSTLADALRARGYYAWDSGPAFRWAIDGHRLQPTDVSPLDVLRVYFGEWTVLQILCVVPPEEAMHRLSHGRGSHWSISDLEDQARMYRRWRDAAISAGIPVLELATTGVVGTRVAVAQATAWVQTKLAR